MALPVAGIIVEYDSGPHLRRAVESLLAAGASELFIIDNASRMPAHERLSDLLPRVALIRNAQNRGFAAACNQGLIASSAPYLFFLNPDARCDAEALKHLVALLEATPKAGAVGPLLTDEKGRAQWGCARAFPGLRLAFKRLVARTAEPHPALAAGLPFRVEAISGAAMLVRRAAAAQVGPWDESFFLHGEDLDWCARFWRSGWEIWVEPRARVVHAQGISSRNRSLFWISWCKATGVARFWLKHFIPHYLRPLAAPLLLPAAAVGALLLWAIAKEPR